jgi:hypothetical protein
MNNRLSLIAISALGIASVVALVPRSSNAVQTRTIVIDSAVDLLAGTLDRTSVTSDGSVVLGSDITRVALDPAASSAWCIYDAGDALYVGSAVDGRVYKITNGRAELWANTGSVAVTAIVAGDNNTLFAATLGEGTIMKLRGPENGRVRDAERFVRLPGVEHIWALRFDSARHTLLAATGPEGKLFAIDAQARPSVLFDADEPHLYSLALGENNNIYVGTGGTAAVVYHVQRPGVAQAIARLVGNEVKAITTVGPLVYAIANEFPEAPEAPRRSVAPSRVPSPGGTGATRPRPGRGALYMIREPGITERMYQSADTHLTALEWDNTRHELFVGMGANGRVLAVSEDRTARIAFDVDETSVLSLSLTGRIRAFGTGDSGAVYLVQAGRPERPTWTSRVLDATSASQWGAVRWRGTGSLDWEYRSGNSDPADNSWSAWTALRDDGTVPSTTTRYLQIRARFSRDPATVLRAVTVYYLPRNQRPIVTEVTTESRAGDVRPPVVRLNWKVENPDNDSIRYRLRYRGDNETAWRPLLRNSDYSTLLTYEWNVDGLPEGFYRVMVEASDEASNAEGDALSDRRESEPLLVDHSAPALTVRVDNGRIVGNARDGASAVTRVEVAFDTMEWRPARAQDGVFDERDEGFEARVPTGLSQGEHTVAVRAYDEAGNMGSATVTLRQ